jgi:hypothetical protein
VIGEAGALGDLIRAAHQALLRQIETVADPHRFLVEWYQHQAQELTVTRCPRLRLLLWPAFHRRSSSI